MPIRYHSPEMTHRQIEVEFLSLLQCLVMVTLIEMMIAIGLAVTWKELAQVASNRRLIIRSTIANYVCVPVVTVVLVLVAKTPPQLAAGLMILAVCPGASYGPPITMLANGNLPAAVGLMTLLAGSSAVLAPVMLYALLPLVSGHEQIAIDLTKMLGVLMATQFVPLCIGLAIRHWRPSLAESIRRPANSLGLVLNLILVGWIIATKYQLFGQLDLARLLSMSALLVFCLVTGWFLGGPGKDDRKAMALTTSLRNVGLSLVIAITAFPESPAVTAVLGYGFFEITGSLLIASYWRNAVH